uniref:Uncharacterized protein n=1 Tax=Candidozyma auris TaxID=498019 RepID=A0A0L0NTC0_CANAR
MLKIPDKSSILILMNLFRIIKSSMCMLCYALLFFTFWKTSRKEEKMVTSGWSRRERTSLWHFEHLFEKDVVTLYHGWRNGNLWTPVHQLVLIGNRHILHN